MTQNDMRILPLKVLIYMWLKTLIQICLTFLGPLVSSTIPFHFHGLWFFSFRVKYYKCQVLCFIGNRGWHTAKDNFPRQDFMGAYVGAQEILSGRHVTSSWLPEWNLVTSFQLVHIEFRGHPFSSWPLPTDTAISSRNCTSVHASLRFAA